MRRLPSLILIITAVFGLTGCFAVVHPVVHRRHRVRAVVHPLAPPGVVISPVIPVPHATIIIDDHDDHHYHRYRKPYRYRRHPRYYRDYDHHRKYRYKRGHYYRRHH